MRLGLIAVLGLCACSRTDTDPPPRVASGAVTIGKPTMPAWFGRPNAPTQRIAGQLWDGDVPLAGTVHLRMVAPDATLWIGLDLPTRADGQFDFGSPRAGRYTIYATAAGKTSRLVEVDTLETAADDLAIYAYRCKPVTGTVLATHRPLQGAQIDLGGVIVATTDRSGKYTICASSETLTATIRAPGYGAVFARVAPPAITELAEASELIGDVLEKNGKPAIGVAVQPIAESATTGVPVQATTDSFGRFTIRGAAIGRYNFEILDGTSRLIDRTTIGPASGEAGVHVKLAYAHAEPRPALTAAVTGRIIHAGHPLADARVAIAGSETRTRPDGTFVLAVAGPGHAILEIDHPTGLATARTIAVAPRSEVTIEVGSTGLISGTAFDTDGKPLARGQIRLSARDTAVERIVTPGVGGHFAFEDIELGEAYDLEILAPGTHRSIEVALEPDRPNLTGLELR